jgi:CubicO group peptidase (beta-lactamase class C family)
MHVERGWCSVAIRTTAPRIDMLRYTLALLLATAPCGLPAQDAETPPDPTDDALAVVADGFEATHEGITPAELEAFVDGVVLTLKREHGLAALTVSVVKDDALWLARGYGQADVASDRAAEAEYTLFRIGSVSKTFTWTAVMMLAERGQLDLDADVNMYLKQVRVDDAFGQPVTMRHLMHHRAGFEDSMRLFAVADSDPRTLSELLAEHQPKRVFAPGARTSYSNWGAALAAQIVEDVANLPYGEFLQQEILFPLGMRDTTWVAPSQLDEATRARLASGYRKGQGALKAQGYMQIGAYWPAGGIASSATDMTRWMRLHLNRGELEGVRLMRADTHAQMWTRAFDDRPAAADVAHGFQDRVYRELRLFGHGGGTAAFLTNMVLVPELGLGVFMSQNGTYASSPLAQLPERIIDRIAGLPLQVALEAEADASGTLDALAGPYLHNRRVFTSFAKLLASSSVAKVEAVSADTLRVSVGGEATQYRALNGQDDVFEANDGRRIAFLRDGDGQVVAAADSSGVHTLEKVGFLRTPNALFMALGLAALLTATSLLGFWWRIGRPRRGGFASTVAAGIGLLACLVTLGFFVATGLLVQGFAGFDLSEMPGNYPSPAMLHMHYAGWALAGAAAAMVFALWPAWSGSGWGLWRRFHFSLYALALVSLAAMLWHWRVIGAPLY